MHKIFFSTALSIISLVFFVTQSYAYPERNIKVTIINQSGHNIFWNGEGQTVLPDGVLTSPVLPAIQIPAGERLEVTLSPNTTITKIYHPVVTLNVMCYDQCKSAASSCKFHMPIFAELPHGLELESFQSSYATSSGDDFACAAEQIDRNTVNFVLVPFVS
jgi:hypothetical protein